MPFEWRQGQHVALVGDTGTGKTTVAQALLRVRMQANGACLVMRSKPDDVKWAGFHKTRRALPAMATINYDRILLEPRFEDQFEQFAIALDLAFRQGGWCVFIDDLPYVQELGAPVHSQKVSLVKRLLTMGRSIGVSVITAMQRPVDVTRYSIGEARITISFMLEGRDVDAIAQSTSPFMAEVVESLGEHDVAMFHRPSRAVWAGRLDLASGLFEGQYLDAGRPGRSSVSAALGA